MPDAQAEGDEVARRRRAAAAAAHARLRAPGGDALSALNALCAFERAGRSEAFCRCVAVGRRCARACSLPIRTHAASARLPLRRAHSNDALSADCLPANLSGLQAGVRVSTANDTPLWLQRSEIVKP